jgi:DNA-binding protein H-NS
VRSPSASACIASSAVIVDVCVSLALSNHGTFMLTPDKDDVTEKYSFVRMNIVPLRTRFINELSRHHGAKNGIARRALMGLAIIRRLHVQSDGGRNHLFNSVEKDINMATTDLSKYNLSELKQLQVDIEKEIKGRQQSEVKKAREQILSIAQTLGVSVEDLLAADSKKKSKGGNTESKGEKVRAQYRNPADAEQTWTGRGRQPKWVVEALGQGKKLEDFRIQ